jgi:Fe-S-cluster containining protein
LDVKLSRLSESYRLLVRSADAAFQCMVAEHAASVKCERGCSDCCHAVFGLFLVEAAHLKQQFDRLGEEEREAALRRCERAERDLVELECRLAEHSDDPAMQAFTMATQRVRCPLLDEQEECVIHPHRPITCRVYGIPTAVRGEARVCGKAGFSANERYPVFDLDGVQRALFILSRELLEGTEQGDAEKASLLISVSKAIRTPLDGLLDEIFR